VRRRTSTVLANRRHLLLRLRGGGKTKLDAAYGGTAKPEDESLRVKLQLKLVDAGADEEASLYYKQSDGRLHREAVVCCGDTALVETWPGCVWVLKGRRTRVVLLRVVAQAAPAVQRHYVHAVGENEMQQRAPSLAAACAPAPLPPPPMACSSALSRKRRDHDRSDTAVAKRRKKRREQTKARKRGLADQPSEVARCKRIKRAEAIAFDRGVRAERAAAKQRRLAKKHARGQLKASAQAARRAARRRRASGL